MFSVTLQVLEEQARIRDIFYSMENILSDLCKPIRLGASYICSTSKDSLITVYLLQEASNTRFQLQIRIESNNAEELTGNLGKLSSILKQNNIHATLVNTLFRSL